MTISSIASYVTTADEFIAHWTDVDADRVANSLPELTIAGGFTLANFTADRDALDAKITALVGLENANEEAIDERDLQKTNLRDRLSQFRLAVRLNLKGTTYFKRVPTLPPLGTSESKFLRPFDDMADMWGRINADTGVPGFTPPLLLTGGYTAAGFTSDLTDLRGAFKAVTDAENDEDIARKERDAMLEPLKERMFQYRAAVELEYGPGHPFTQSLPEISPSSSGTPEPVTADGSWDGMTEEAVITFSESTDPNLADYELRGNSGTSYNAGTAIVIDSLVAGTEPREFRTTQFLTNPSDEATFKVYVILTTANEAGSLPVTITRP